MRRLIAAGALALACLSGGAGAQVALDPDEMRQAALQAVAVGDDPAALRLTEALLARDPGDVTALMVRSRVQRNAGDAAAARQTAKAAWNAATTPEERFRAAMIRAQALASDGAGLRAQFWLRRAVEMAPSEAARAQVIRDFRYVRSRTPLRLKLDLDVSPSSNVNNGSSETVAVLFGLPFELSGASRALSGMRYAAGLSLGYDLTPGERHRDSLELLLHHETFSLSDEAKAIAPGAKGSDFAFTALRVGARRLFSAGAGEGIWGVDAHLGRNWYGGDPLAHYARAGVDHTMALGKRSRLRLRAEHEWQKRETGGTPVLRKTGASGTVIHRLQSGARLQFALGLSESDSADIRFDYSEFSADLAFSPAEPVMGAELTFRTGAAWLDFPSTPYKAGGREDSRAHMAVEMAFTGIDRWGFSPVVTVQGSWRDSDVDLFDSDALGVQLGVTSSF